MVVFIVHHRFEHWIYALMGSILFAEKVSSAEIGERIMENHFGRAKKRSEVGISSIFTNVEKRILSISRFETGKDNAC